MRVLLTGGTGLVGSHCVPKLLEHSHEVRLLVRSREKAASVLGVHQVDVDALDVVEGDVTDRGLVERALVGCEAVISAASFFSLRPRDEAEVRRVNLEAAEVVLGSAHRLGLDPIVHVSSISVLVDEVPGTLMTEDSPIGAPHGAYAESKAAADRFARGLQDQGVPVVLTYPTMVLGPYDPTMGAGMTSLALIARGLVVVQPKGGMDVVDVRDVAEGHVAALKPGCGPRRFLFAGHHLTTKELIALVGRLTGRHLRSADMPNWLAYAGARIGDALQRHLPLELPLTTDGVELLLRDCIVDASRTRSELALSPTPLETTLGDALIWMAGEGIITERQVGRLALAGR
jgi:dihydroflavonol-4-reductase